MIASPKYPAVCPYCKDTLPCDADYRLPEHGGYNRQDGFYMCKGSNLIVADIRKGK